MKKLLRTEDKLTHKGKEMDYREIQKIQNIKLQDLPIKDLANLPLDIDADAFGFMVASSLINFRD